MLILNRGEVEALLDLDKLLEAVSVAMVDVSEGRASLPPRIAARVPECEGLLGAMPAYCPSLEVLAAKLVSLYPKNDPDVIPTHQAAIMVFDHVDGRPLAVMDGTYITAIRTAAGSALATRLMSREDSRVLTILGTGVQARAHAQMIPRVRTIREIRVYGRSREKAVWLANEIQEAASIPALGFDGLAEAMTGADVVCATTHPHEPVVRREHLQPGMHVNSVGVSNGGQEVDLEAIRSASVFVEQRSVVSRPMPAGSDELFHAFEQGALAPDEVAEIGEVVSGKRPGRTSADQITLYKSIGVAVQDAAAAALVLTAARAKGTGLEVEL